MKKILHEVWPFLAWPLLAIFGALESKLKFVLYLVGVGLGIVFGVFVPTFPWLLFLVYVYGWALIAGLDSINQERNWYFLLIAFIVSGGFMAGGLIQLLL